MKSQEIRNAFIDFFVSKDHKFLRSSPVVPIDDPTLLFTNAGMNQFKPIFLGQAKPDNLRVVNSQKCIRVSGKHNDLEEVGIDNFHHTFFEMLGNWSFGDYYKSEAIQWAWELFTEAWGLDKNRLWVSVYNEDQEAFDLWPKVTDIDPKRVLKCGKKDNFWEMGETGPCGPCSEIHYFIGEDLNKQTPKGVNNSDEYWELWNLVFIQNNRLDDGSLENLPQKHVDTGAGFERIVSVLQKTYNNYTTDLFLPIIKETESLTGQNFIDNPAPFQVIADHIRMLGFSIADGCMPGNEGRGYVLRRILRRAARFGRILNQKDPFIFQLTDVLCDIMGDAFPEIKEKKIHIEKVIRSEEEIFGNTLGRGLNHFDKVLSNLSGKNIPGKEAFKLYDTYGFPLDLTQLLAREKGISVDEEGFNVEMNEQRLRAKLSTKFNQNIEDLNWVEISEGENFDFVGYETTKTKSLIQRYCLVDDQVLVVLDISPFYAESGGQIGDTGLIKGEGVDLIVNDVKKDGDVFIHYCSGNINNSTKGNVSCEVDYDRRQNIRKNHTATHLMHKALKEVLGDHVQQAGSLVHADYLRFDLTHSEKISSDQIRSIENIVNQQILINSEIDVSLKSFVEAKKEGAVAMFGEKYGEEVRVITVSDFSKELCGGTHVDRTGDIGLFKIIEESSLASGVRRIVALTGQNSVKYFQEQSSTLEFVQSQLKCNKDSVNDRLSQLLDKKKQLEKELKDQNKRSNNFDLKSILANGKTIDDHIIIIEKTEAESLDELKNLGDLLLGSLKSGIGVLGADSEKPMIVIIVTKDLIESGIKANNLAKEIGGLMGGGGGGKPHLATAGGTSSQEFIKAMDQSFQIIKEEIKRKVS